MSIILGCIADDFTGATDLANTLVKQGMRTVQLIGEPTDQTPIPDADAVVIALKSRSNPPSEAIRMSVNALKWLQGAGAKQYFFKYCSTFDSTDEGNIGPVADALLDQLGENFTIACPAFPENGRTIFKGYLFVGDELLSDSSMKDHPLTPMNDANLVRVLSRQTSNKVGLVSHHKVQQGGDEICAEFTRLEKSGVRHAIVDAVSDDDLLHIAEGLKTTKLITGGSGIALGLPANYRESGWLSEMSEARLPEVTGRQVVLAGSCSAATRKQIETVRTHWPCFEIDPHEVTSDKDIVGIALRWAADQNAETPVLIYSSADPEIVGQAQDKYGREFIGKKIEAVMGGIASGLVKAGFSKLIVAGGETSGAVVQSLGIKALRIGPEIDPGVPWTETFGNTKLALALKSGNFGSEDFFIKAFRMLT